MIKSSVMKFVKNVFRKPKHYGSRSPSEYLKIATFAIIPSALITLGADAVNLHPIKWLGALVTGWFLIDILFDVLLIIHDGGGKLYLQFYEQNKHSHSKR